MTRSDRGKRNSEEAGETPVIQLSSCDLKKKKRHPQCSVKDNWLWIRQKQLNAGVKSGYGPLIKPLQAH